MRFPATVNLDVMVPVVSRTWVEHVTLEGKCHPACPALYGCDGCPFQHRAVLRWETSGRLRRVDPLKVAEQAAAILTPEDAARFWEEHGPLLAFKENQVDFYGRMLPYCVFLWLAALVSISVYGAKPGMPPLVGNIERWLLDPLRQAAKRFPGAARFTWGAAFIDGTAVSGFVPLKESTEFTVLARADWPVFCVPERQPALREEIIAFVQGEIRRNVLARLRLVDIGWGRDGITVSPAHLYDAILAVLALDAPEEKQRRPLSTRAKRDALAYFRVLVQRGKISAVEYEEVVKPTIGRAWQAGVRDIEGLRRRAWEALKRRKDKRRVLAVKRGHSCRGGENSKRRDPG
jgi:hypothetical protein